MFIDVQFSRAAEHAKRGEERGVYASVRSSEIRKRSSRHADAVLRDSRRALRRCEIFGARSIQRERSVVTLAVGGSAWLVKEARAALRMKLCPPEPNQALQPTRMLVTIRAYARLAPSIRVADL